MHLFYYINQKGLHPKTNKLDNFSLEKITEIYQKLEENSCLEYYFVDLNNNPIKIKKVPGKYKIVLENGSNLLVSPEHKVYGKLENQIDQNSSTNSLVLKTLTRDCLLNAVSFDQIPQFKDIANENNGASSICGASFIDSLPNSETNLSSTILTKISNSTKDLKNSFSLILDLEQISFLCLTNS